MICPKGSTCKESDHEVKTLVMAKEWFDGAEAHDLPIRVSQQTSSEGRCRVTVHNNLGQLIYSRG